MEDGAGLRDVVPRSGDCWSPGRVARFVFGHRLELLALFLGFFLRALMAFTYPVERGYDFPDHLIYVNWFRDHLAWPQPTLCRTAYHAPLYYLLAGFARRMGAGVSVLQVASLGIGCLRLIVLAIGMAIAMPGQRTARAIALVLAAVLPSALHLDAMATQEPLSNLLNTAGVVLILGLFRAEHIHRTRWAVALGLVAGLALSTKVSSLCLAATVALAGPVYLLVSPVRAARGWISRLAPWGLALLVMVASGSWWYVHCQLAHGKAVLSSWDFIPSFIEPSKELLARPFLDRRSLGYVLGWSSEIYASPYYPSASEASPRFWPVLVASTFVDYYGYGFHPSIRSALSIAPSSMVGGTVIAVVVAAGWAALTFRLATRREAARLVVLALPGIGIMGQLMFAIRYPLDWEGVVKGVYLHCTAAPLYGVFGLAVTWLWARLVGRPFAALAVLSLAAVAAYSFHARLAWMGIRVGY